MSSTLKLNPLPRLYPILDADLLARRGVAIEDFAAQLRAAGITLLQYRDKQGSPQQILANAASIQQVFAGSGCTLILDDRADLMVLAGWDGVHVGQQDLSPEAVRRVIGAERMIGFSTHNDAQVMEAEQSCADYVAIGPVFSTSSKDNPDPVVGLEGVRRARALTGKPLVAIGGITRANCRQVIDAGADSVAVISELLPSDGSSRKLAEDFLAVLR
ncbi:MAG: thiamine phosphate synthase [Acidobacteriaceae bacterium]